jgi:hypothetical protein
VYDHHEANEDNGVKAAAAADWRSWTQLLLIKIKYLQLYESCSSSKLMFPAAAAAAAQGFQYCQSKK